VSAAEQRLADAGLRLPGLRTPSGRYRGWVRTGDLLFLAGQGAVGHVGRVGADLDVEAGRLAARDCMLNLLAQTKDALGSLDRVSRVVKVLGFVVCSEEFTAAPQVMDGASEVLHTAFGSDAGSHARSAVGVQALPLGFAVEVEMVVEVAS
jgi:enamine deaminase RidA (YjgF/YER057c/UK114 family)